MYTLQYSVQKSGLHMYCKSSRNHSFCLGTIEHHNRSVCVAQVVCGPTRIALVSNFMIDLPWLISACPDLLSTSHLIVVHGDDDERLSQQSRGFFQGSEAQVRSCGFHLLCFLLSWPHFTHSIPIDTNLSQTSYD